MKLIKKLLISIFELVKQNEILAGILFIALLLRFIGVYPGYHPYHSDEGMSYSSAIEMIRNLNIDPTRYDYPSLIPLINAFFYIIFFIPVFILKNLILDNGDLPTKGRNLIELWQQVVIQNQQTDVLFWGRYVTAAFGVGVVFLTYLVTKRLFGDRRVSLIAAFLVAVNFRQVLNSHLGLPDIYNAFFLLLAVLSFANLLKHSTLKNYLLSAVCVGLFFSTKLQIFALPTFVVTHAFIVWKTTTNKTPKNLITKSLNKSFLIGLLIILVVILLINPYHLIKWEEFRAQEGYNLLKYKLGTNALNLFPVSYLFHIGIGKYISILAIFGILLGLRKYTKVSLILLSIIIPFLYFFFYYSGGGYYTRNFVTITPLLLIFTGVFLVESCKFIFKRTTLSNFAIVIILLLISYESINNSIVSTYYFSKPWGFKEANAWAKVNIPEKATVVSHPWDNYPRDKDLKIIPFEISETFSLAEMREEDAQYGFLNMDWLALGSYWWMNRSTKESLEFWEKPNNLLSNTYSSIVAQELASFSVAKFVKPWQAPDMNFLIVKIPKILEFEKKEILNFSFNNEIEFSTWKTVTFNDDGKTIIFDNQVGKEEGSLKIVQGIPKYPTFMAKSPSIKIKMGKAYFIEGWIKSSNVISKKDRDGFLRVDFYNSEPEFNLEDRSIYGSVSSRIYGEPIWHKVEIVTFPPDGVKFMTIGAQANNYNEFWFDDIKVYESILEVPNPRKVVPYLDYRIPNDILFPYSQGGM